MAPRTTRTAGNDLLRQYAESRRGGSSTDPQDRLDRAYARLMASNAPQGMKDDARSTVERVGSGLLGTLGNVLEIIDTPRAALTSTIKESVDFLQGEGFSGRDWMRQTGGNYGFGDLIRDEGGTGTVWGDRIIGFVGDIALDPATYLTFGASAAGKAGMRLGSRQVANMFLTDGVEKFGRQGAEELAARVTQRGVWAVSRDDLAKIGVERGMFFTAPGTGRIGRGVQRAVGVQNPTARVARVSSGETFGQAARGATYVRQRVRQTNFHQAVQSAYSGELGKLRSIIKSSDSATKVVVAQRVLDFATQARGRASAIRQQFQRQLADVNKAARAAGIDGVTLGNALREGVDGATFQGLSDAQRAVVIQARDMTASWRQRLNAELNDEWIKERDNYVFRTLSEQARKQGLGRAKRNKYGAAFPLASVENAALKPGDQFLGKTLTANAPVEEQIEQIAKEAFGGEYVQLLEDDFFRAMSSYISGTTRRTREKLLERSLVDNGLGAITGVVPDRAVLPDMTYNPNNPIVQGIEGMFEAMDAAGGTTWTPSITEVGSQAAREHNLGRVTDIEEELANLNVASVEASMPLPDRPPSPVATVDPTDMPMSQQERIGSVRTAADDPMAAAVAAEQAANPTAAAAALRELDDLNVTMRSLIDDVVRIGTETAQGQARGTAGAVSRLKRQINELTGRTYSRSQLRLAAEAFNENADRLSAEIADVTTRANAIRAEIDNLAQRRRANIAADRPQKIGSREAAAKAELRNVKRQIKQLQEARTVLRENAAEWSQRADMLGEVAGTAAVAGATRGMRDELAGTARSAAGDVRGARSRVAAAAEAERKTLGADRRRVSRNIRDANKQNTRTIGQLDRTVKRSDRKTRRLRAQIDAPRRRAALELELKYRRRAEIIFQASERFAAEIPGQAVGVPGARESMRLQAQTNVAYADLLARGEKPTKLENVGSLLREQADRILWLHQSSLNQYGPQVLAEDWVVDTLKEASQMATPADVGLFGKAFDRITGYWKTQALLSPGYHWRNYIGGMWNNYLAGVEIGAYRRYRKAQRAFNDLLAAEGGDLQAALTKARTMTVPAGKGQVRPSDVAYIAQLVDAGVFANVGRAADEIPTSLLGSATNRVTGPVVRAQQWGSDTVESNLRGALGLDVLSKGGTADDAYESVIKHHFDYTDISSSERTLRRIIPFYSFSRHNFPLQLEALITQPGKVNNFLAVKENLELGAEEDGIVPRWFSDNMAIRLPFKFGGQSIYVMPDLPLKDLRMLDWVGQAASDDIGGAFGNVASMANPFVKAPAELALDTKFFSNIPLQQDFVQAPSYLGGIPGMRNALEAAGVLSRGTDGGFYGRDELFYMIDQALPLVGRLRRLLPSEEQYNDRIFTTWAAFLFGPFPRTLTDTEQRNEIYRRLDKVESITADARSLGYEMPTTERGPNPIEQFFARR